MSHERSSWTSGGSSRLSSGMRLSYWPSVGLFRIQDRTHCLLWRLLSSCLCKACTNTLVTAPVTCLFISSISCITSTASMFIVLMVNPLLNHTHHFESPLLTFIDRPHQPVSTLFKPYCSLSARYDPYWTVSSRIEFRFKSATIPYRLVSTRFDQYRPGCKPYQYPLRVGNAEYDTVWCGFMLRAATGQCGSNRVNTDINAELNSVQIFWTCSKNFYRIRKSAGIDTGYNTGSYG